MFGLMAFASSSGVRGSIIQDLDNINVTEVLDRVLDHGIVVDPATRIFLLDVNLRSMKGKLVVESVQTSF
jgi:Gas vesicle protein